MQVENKKKNKKLQKQMRIFMLLMNQKFKFCIFIIILNALILANAAGSKQKTLVYCSEASPDSFNPMLSASLPTFDATTDTIYNRLIQFSRSDYGFDEDSGLAERYSVSDDGLSYTFYLRKNIPFHQNSLFKPSRPFNADDVLFTFQRQADKNHPYHKIGASQYLYFKRNLADNFKGISKIDDYTIKIDLNHADKQFLAFIASANLSIQSAEYAQLMLAAGTPELIDTKPIGTGPFQFVDYAIDAIIRYQAFDQYWHGREKIDNLIFSITPDAAVRAAKLINGECDIMVYPNPSDLPKLKAAANVNVLEKPSLNTGYLAFNATKTPFEQKKVRQALAYAINKPKIIDAIYSGQADIADNILPKPMKYYNHDLNNYEYSPEKARALLAEAGFKEGFSTTIWAMPVSRPYNPNARRMAEIIQADWAAIGVKAEIKSFEWAEYLKRARAGEHEVILMGWAGMNTEPESFLESLFTCKAFDLGSNYARFCKPEYDALLQKALAESDLKKREAYFKSLQEILIEEVPLVPIAHSKLIQPISKRVRNFDIGVFQQNDFKGLDVED